MKTSLSLGVVFLLGIGALACGILQPPAPPEPSVEPSPSAVEPAPTGTTQATSTRVLLPTPQSRPSSSEGISALVAIHDVRWYRTSYGGLEFIGLATNNGQKGLKSLEVAVILQEEAGRIVAVVVGPTELAVILPGETSPFRAVFLDLPPPWQEYQILAQGGTSDYVDKCRDFEILSQSMERSGSDSYEIKGEIKNTGSETCEYIHVSAALYDAGGNLIGLGSAYVRRERVKPGETSRFELFGYDTGLGEADRFELWAEGNPKP